MKKVLKILSKKFKEELTDYIVLEAEVPSHKLLKPGLIAFGVVTIVFLIHVFVVHLFDYFTVFYFLAFIVLVAYPVSKSDQYKNEIIILTPNKVIQRIGKKEFSIVEYEKITSFRETESTYYVKGNGGTEIFINRDFYSNEVDQLIDVLEALGKTFNKEKDYMIRPVEISIDDGKIVITDIKEEDTKEEKITFSLLSRYDTLTPGFLKEFIPKNAIVYNAYVKENDLYLELSHLEVNGGHPENTTFDAIKVEDCIMILMDAKINQLSKREENDRKAPFNALSADLDTFIEEVKDGVVSEWRFRDNSTDLIFAVGIGALRTELEFGNVLVGWNKVK